MVGESGARVTGLAKKCHQEFKYEVIALIVFLQ